MKRSNGKIFPKAGSTLLYNVLYLICLTITKTIYDSSRVAIGIS
jgi:hypothetical protein